MSFKATLASLDMDLDLLLYPASLEELMAAGKALDGSTADDDAVVVGESSGGKLFFDPNMRRLLTPSPSAAVRSLAAAEHAKAVRSARRLWTNGLEEEEEEEEENDAIVGLDAATERKLRESPHWKHLAWTLDDNDDLW